jgi:hypothetical protein
VSAPAGGKVTLKTYTVRDEQGRFMSDGTNRRQVEQSAAHGARTFGGCWFVSVGEELVTLVERVGRKVDVSRLDAP